MSIDLGNEELLSLNDARQLFPRRRAGKRPSFVTVWRWATAGVNGVILECVRIGSTLCTSRAAIERFITAQTENDSRLNGGRRSTTPAARTKAATAAEAELAAEGF